jgi:hypothetical protein
MRDANRPLENLPEYSTELIKRFTGLGANCEFGFVQRAYAVEPLDLFRWASTRLSTVIDLLNNRFDGIADAANIRLRPTSAGEYMVDNIRYNFSWHAWAKVDKISPEALLRRECERLPRLAEILVDHLTKGDRVMVIKALRNFSLGDIEPLRMAIRKYGDAPLLFVNTTIESQAVAGTVEVAGDLLLRGHIDRFAAPESVPRTTNPEIWLQICEAAKQTIVLEYPTVADRIFGDEVED